MGPRFKCLLVISMIMVMTGCASKRHIPKVAGANKSYQERLGFYNTLPCCKPLNELNVTNLKDEIIMSMEENKHLVILNNVKTNYMLFKLPQDNNSHYYGIRSFYIDHKFAYIPQVTALDQNFSVLNSTHPSYLQYQHQTLVWDDSHFWLYFKFNTAINSKAKYFIVHMQAPTGSKFQTNPEERTNVEATFINGQPSFYAQNSTSFSFPTLVAPSGILQLQKLNSWNKPINDSIFYEF